MQRLGETLPKVCCGLCDQALAREVPVDRCGPWKSGRPQRRAAENFLGGPRHI